MTDRRRILDRIQKCLRLAESPEPNEAAAALRQAQALMERHGITEAEVRMADVGESRATTAQQSQRPPLWMLRLAETVASAFGVSVHFESSWRGPLYVVFVGVEPAAEIADYAWTVLRRRCAADRRAHYRRLRGKRANRVHRADAYALGWVAAVHAQAQAFARPVPDIVGQYLAHHHPGLQRCEAINRIRNRDGRDALRGIADGQRVELNHGMTGGDAPGRLEGNTQ